MLVLSITAVYCVGTGLYCRLMRPSNAILDPNSKKLEGPLFNGDDEYAFSISSAVMALLNRNRLMIYTLSEPYVMGSLLSPILEVEKLYPFGQVANPLFSWSRVGL